MNYKAYKFIFSSPVHFGKRNLDDCEYAFCADTLFSALYIEALKLGGEKAEILRKAFEESNLRISDAMPFVGKEYYLPKPMLRIEGLSDKKADSAEKKAYKKLKYIPASLFTEYVSGRFDVMKNGLTDDCIGYFDTKVRASITYDEETKPYYVEEFVFNENSGLYVIAAYSDSKCLECLEECLEALQYAGIGGKRYSGKGRFELLMGTKLPEEIVNRLENERGKQMTLSISLPEESEMEYAVTDADYLILKRSGFVQSETYSDTLNKKRDLFMIKSGGCFSKRYLGGIYNVSSEGGRHPVYRYGIPMFMGVD